MNRRRFLKEAATVASAATVAGSLSAPSALLRHFRHLRHLRSNHRRPRDRRAFRHLLFPTRIRRPDRRPHTRAQRSRRHGGRDQGARPRVHLHQPGLQLPRPARVDRQLRAATRQPEFLTCCHEESSVAMAHGYAKIEGKPLGVLGARHRRPPARGDGGLQRLLRSRAGLHHSRQHVRRDRAAAWRRMGAQRAGRGGDGARLHRSGTTCRCRSRTSPNRRCARTRSR